jgi:undecaprenyl-diphosphatase
MRVSRVWVLAASVALAGFALLAVAVVRDTWVVGVDGDVSRWVAHEMPAVVEWVARGLSVLGGWIGITVATVAVVLALLAARRVATALWLALAVVGIEVLTPLTKAGYDRERPDLGSPIVLPSSSSFPSGHASGGLVTAGVIAVVAAERWPDARVRIWMAAAVVAAAIGASRVALNVHYVSDVLAGWCLGLAWLAALVVARQLRSPP